VASLTHVSGLWSTTDCPHSCKDH